MIEVKNLQKKFGDFVAVDDISFKVVPGEILGFLGPNGAGKSTTMKMITGFVKPTRGSANIWGSDIEEDRLTAQKHIGYLPEGTPAYDEMTPRGFLAFIAEVRGFGKKEGVERVRAVSTTMSLDPVLDQRIETLSKGFKRRVGLAQAIIHDPDILILDEPTDGLDPNQKHQVREMIRGLSKDKIVIISTHILEEVTAVCTRAVIIANGRIVSDCSPTELEQMSHYHEAVTLKFDTETQAREAVQQLEDEDLIQEVEIDGSSLLLVPKQRNGQLLPGLVEIIKQKDWDISGLYQERGRLDDVFRTITEEARTC